MESQCVLAEIRRAAAVLILVAVCSAPAARGVIFYATADPTYNTNAPTGTLAGSGWQWIGNWDGFEGTPIGPHHFLTARHVGGTVGDPFTFGGITYTTTAFFDDSLSDLRVCEVSGTFPAWAPLYSSSGEIGQGLVVIGKGDGRGDPVVVGGATKGWMWGSGSGTMRWGQNTFNSVVDGGSYWGSLLYALFEAGKGSNEADLAVGDSSSPVFMNDGSGWKLAGIAAAVDGPFNTTSSGGGFQAAIFDASGLYVSVNGSWVLQQSAGVIATGFYATRVSARAAWVNSALLSPWFSAQPVSQTVSNTSTVVLQASASGTPAPTYQWYFNGSPLSVGSGLTDVTDGTLVIHGATTGNAGPYTCVATNAAGSVTSAQATVAVSATTDVGRLVNVSSRANVGIGGNILIAGFVVGGAGTNGTESLLIRASGPVLTALNVAGALPDPQIQLYQRNANGTSSLLQTNNGWAGSAAIAKTAAAVGAFAWTNPASHDSALLETLSAGTYTAQISGQGGDSGVALAEVYDATTPGTYTAGSPRLINLSSRAQVGTAGNIIVAGFVIGGSTSRTVLLRGSGPALIPLGVAGTLPDPELQLYQTNADGTSTLLESNTGWAGDKQIAAAAASVGAFSWGTPATADSAILITLPPGPYTAQVSGAGGDTGVALVEVYEVP